MIIYIYIYIYTQNKNVRGVEQKIVFFPSLKKKLKFMDLILGCVIFYVLCDNSM